MSKKIGPFFEAFLLLFMVKKCDYLCLAVQINVLLDNARYSENVEYATDVNLLALCGPSVWREHVVTCPQLSSTSNLTILLLLLLIIILHDIA